MFLLPCLVQTQLPSFIFIETDPHQEKKGTNVAPKEAPRPLMQIRHVVVPHPSPSETKRQERPADNFARR